MKEKRESIKYKKSTRAPTLNINNKILPKSKRSQSAIEFSILLGFVLFFFVVFFGVIQANQADKNRDKEKIAIQNVALQVQREISFAAESTEGYLREFKTPLNVLGKEYNITLANDRVYVSLDNLGVAYNINPVIGPINKGSNIIEKENGTVYLNQ